MSFILLCSSIMQQLHYSGTSSIFHYTARAETHISAFREKKKASEPTGKHRQTWQNNISAQFADIWRTDSINKRRALVYFVWPCFHMFLLSYEPSWEGQNKEKAELCVGACNNMDRADSIFSSWHSAWMHFWASSPVHSAGKEKERRHRNTLTEAVVKGHFLFLV